MNVMSGIKLINAVFFKSEKVITVKFFNIALIRSVLWTGWHLVDTYLKLKIVGIERRFANTRRLF